MCAHPHPCAAAWPWPAGFKGRCAPFTPHPHTPPPATTSQVLQRSVLLSPSRASCGSGPEPGCFPGWDAARRGSSDLTFSQVPGRREPSMSLLCRIFLPRGATPALQPLPPICVDGDAFTYLGMKLEQAHY